MESMRSTWTDSRLDDLNRRVDEGFRELRGEIGSLQRTIIQVGGGMIAAFVALMAAVLGLMGDPALSRIDGPLQSSPWPTWQS
jgi:hypothetical protein